MKLNFLKSISKKSSTISKILLVVLTVVICLSPKVEASGSLTTVKDTLSNNRPSVASAITVAVTAGDTSITVASTLGIAQGDTVTFCGAAATCTTTETKVVASVNSNTQFSVTVGTTNSYTTSGFVYLKSVSVHTVTFTTRSAVSSGSFVVTLAGSTNSNTSTPVSAGFSFNGISTTTDISVSGFTAATTATSTASSNLIFTFTYSGSLAASSAITITIGSTNKLLNPTKTATSGTADTFSFTVDQKDNGGNVIDTTSGKVGTIESVGVSATVTPSLSFTINAVAAATPGITGYNMDQSSTATSVPFGNLVVAATTTIAQYINIATNSNSGYVVTAQEDGSLRKSNGTSIVDFDSSTTAERDTTTGFGYSLANKIGTDAAFVFNGSGAAFNGRGFSSTTPFTIMSNVGAVNGSQVYVLYRVKTAATQAQGTYQNLITYIATANY